MGLLVDAVKIGDLETAVETARIHLIEAQEAERVARSEECDCLNRYNTATKALDAALAVKRKGAPYGSDWAESARRVTVAGVIT